jgi:hypoxanthine phosphoribosyltransferase
VSDQTRVPVEVVQALREAEPIADRDTVEAAIDRVAVQLAVELADAYPVLMCVMNGGLVMTARLLERFEFALQLDYVQVSRYRDGTSGGELTWRVEPALPLAGRTVLVIDDIFDQGWTMRGVVAKVSSLGAAQVLSVVLVDKQVAHTRPMEVDYAALTAPDRYLFGCGMDYHGHWRNLPAIYALPESLLKGEST